MAADDLEMEIRKCDAQELQDLASILDAFAWMFKERTPRQRTRTAKLLYTTILALAKDGSHAAEIVCEFIAERAA